MFSERLYSWIAVYGSINKYFGTVPMAWCKTTKTVIPSGSALKKAYLNTFLLIVLDTFTVFQLVRFHIAQEYENLNVVLLFGLGIFVCTETFALMTFQENDTRVTVNGLLSYLRYMNSKYRSI